MSIEKITQDNINEQKGSSSSGENNSGTPIQLQKIAQMIKNPASMNPQTIIQMQKTYGNKAVTQFIQQAKAQQAQAKQNNTGLPDTIKQGVENLSGTSMDDVKVHYNSSKPNQLGAHAYTQGTEIHVAPGQEQHLAHEAWHVVQQKQGRVQPTTQKGGAKINDNPGLEKEADVMGAKSLEINVQDSVSPGMQPKEMQNSNSPVQTVMVTQLALDDNNQLPAAEQDGLDNFLTSNGHDPAKYSEAQYTELKQAYSLVRGLHNQINQNASGNAVRKRRINAAKAQAREGIQPAYQTLVDNSRDYELLQGTAAWTTAAEAAADAYGAARDGGYAAPSAAAWPGRGAMPPAFQNAVQAVVTARDAEVAAAYQGYINDGRLLPGTITDMKPKLVFPTLAQANAHLQTVYLRQSQVSRDNWLTHLGIAGRKIIGSANQHYTVFNDAVTNPYTRRVDNQSVQQIMDGLFGAVSWQNQIHATVVAPDGTSYHQYYDGSYNPNPPAGQITTKLNAEHNKMLTALRAKVTEAQRNHGRVANNSRAQQLDTNP